MELSKRIREYLIEKGIKNTYVCEKTGITQNALTLTLNGKRKLLADEYVAICKVLDVSTDYFTATDDKSA